MWRRLLFIAAAASLLAACANPFAGQMRSPVLTVPTPTPTPTPLPSPSPSPSPTAALQAFSPPFRVGEVGANYPSASFSASGGLAPYTWTVASGGVPPGLNLASDGGVAGSPSSAGTYSFTVQVADSGNSSTTVSATIEIRPAITARLTPGCTRECSVENDCAFALACSAFGIVAGGVGPYRYSLVSGSTPPGTTVAPDAFALVGRYSDTTGTYTFTAQVTDSYGETATLSPNFRVYPQLSLTGGHCNYPNVTPPDPPIPAGDLCYQVLTYTGGVPGRVTLNFEGWSCSAPGCLTGPGFPAAPNITGTGSNGILQVTITLPAGYAGQHPFGTFLFDVGDQGLCSVDNKVLNCYAGQFSLVLTYNG